MRVELPSLNAGRTSRATRRIHGILDKKGELWVVNSSEQVLDQGVKAVHFIVFVDQHGKTRHINFPDSYLPICLTAKLDHETIRGSSDFWAYVNAGMLKAIPPKKARALLRAPDAEEERERLELRSRGSRGQRKTGERLRKQGGIRPTGSTRFDDRHPDDKGGRDSRSEDEGPKISNRVMAICGRVEAGHLTTRAAVAELKNMKLGRADLGYIMGNARVLQKDERTGEEFFDDTVANWAEDLMFKKAMRTARKRGGSEFDPAAMLAGQVTKKGKKGKKRRAA